MKDTQLIDLDIRITHQEAAIQTLNDVVTQQQKTIDQLQKEMSALKTRLRDVTPSNIAAPWEETPPPHY